jgi:hypothetical protein
MNFKDIGDLKFERFRNRISFYRAKPKTPQN